MRHVCLGDVEIFDLGENLQLLCLVSPWAVASPRKFDIDNGSCCEKGGIVFDAGGDLIEVGGEDDLNHPDGESHVNEDEYCGGSLDEDVDEDIQGVLIAIEFAQFVEPIIVCVLPNIHPSFIIMFIFPRIYKNITII